MYNMPLHKAYDKQDVISFIQQYPFAFITGCNEEHKPIVTQVPLIIEERDGTIILSGHIMRHTDHHLAFVNNPSVLVVFTGPNTYVSASWYSNPHKGSTWNYMSVHANGKIKFLDDNRSVEVMRKLTTHFEGGNVASPTIYDNLPETYTTTMIKGIAIFEVVVEDIDSVFKLSQDRDETSYDSIILKLNAQGGNAALIAKEMKQRKNKVSFK